MLSEHKSQKEAALISSMVQVLILASIFSACFYEDNRQHILTALGHEAVLTDSKLLCSFEVSQKLLDAVNRRQTSCMLS